MIRYDPDSFSKIARATHIIDAKLLAYTASEWRPDEALALDKRDVSATIAVARIWKGDPVVSLHEPLTIQFTQYQYRDVIRFALPGVWSRHELVEGARYFLFSRGATSEVLLEPQLFFVETAEAAALDVELADRSGCPPARLGVLLDEAEPYVPSLGILFPEYVASRIPEMFFEYPADYHRLFRIMESAAAPAHLRWIWLREVTSWLSMMDPPPPVFAARTVFGFFRIAVTAGADMKQAILGTYLPNLLGLTGGLTRKVATEVFYGLPAAFQQCQGILQENPDLPNQPQLLEWFQVQ